MLEKLKNFIDMIFPRRQNAVIVENLLIQDLPQASQAEDWIHALFNYKDKRVRAIIWEVKYKENISILENIGKLLYDKILSCTSEILLFDKNVEFLLIPIPLSAERFKERGYNQSQYIAKSILEYDTEHKLLYTPQWLRKIKDTLPQSLSQSKQERMKNLKNCFQADSRVKSRYIILIDDVVTTGTTLAEAKRTLIAAGAEKVLAFTIAH